MNFRKTLSSAIVSIFLVTLVGCAASDAAITEEPTIVTVTADIEPIKNIPTQEPIIINEDVDITYFVDNTGEFDFEGFDDNIKENQFGRIQTAVTRATNNQENEISTRILLAPGTYTEEVRLRGFDTGATIIIEALEPDTVVFSGSDVWDDWEIDSDNPHLLRHEWTYDLGPHENPWDDVTVDIRALHAEMIFVDGDRIRQAFTFNTLTEGSFFIDEDAQRAWLWIPQHQVNNPTIEVAVRRYGLFLREAYNVIIRNFEFKHYTSSAGEGALYGRDCRNFLLEDSSFFNNNWAGVDIRNCENLTMRNLVANHNGHRGLGAANMVNLVVDNVENNYNNWRGAQGHWYGWDAGQKFLRIHGGIFRNYEAKNNEAAGFWLDFDSENVIFEDSYICDNYQVGMFLEASQGPLIIRNSTICNTRIGNDITFTNAGLFSTNTENVIFENNRLYGNEGYQIHIREAQQYRGVTNWQTGEEYDLEFKSWRIFENYIASLSDTQNLVALPDREIEDVFFYNNTYDMASDNGFYLKDRAISINSWSAYDSSILADNNAEQPVPPIKAGIIGEYFNDGTLSESVLVREDYQIKLNNSKLPEEITNSQFSVRWSGQLNAETEMLYTFYVISTGTATVTIGNQTLIDCPAEQEECIGTIYLTDSPQNFVIEYSDDKTDLSKMLLYWSSAETPKRIIPSQRFMTVSSE